jgi:FlaA1/EpsC-like NDP-sugar epimerase
VSRYLTRGLQVAADLLVLSLVFWLAFLFRFEFQIPKPWLRVALFNWPYIVALQYAALALFGVPSYSWRYISMREMLLIATATATSTALLVLLRFASRTVDVSRELFFLPFGVLAMNAVLVFVGLVGVRALRRLQGEAQDRKARAARGEMHRVLLVGAGQAGVLVARELRNRPDLGLVAVGFVDDDIHKVGMRIGGHTVLGTTEQIAEIAERKRVKRVLITIASAPGPDIRRVTMRCKDAGLDTKIIPGLYEIVGDQVNLSRIRDVGVEDLLGREPVSLDEDQVEDSIRGHAVLVTGAGGSIGSELCRQVARFTPSRLVLVERFENALFEIHRELAAAFPELRLEPCIADVCDATRMDQIFAANRPELVFHAAAHKHVPMMEHNPGEAVKNNVGGTRCVAELADRHGVGRFVLVSTDKAVNPSSVMGATKRVAELLCQGRAQQSKTRFVTVRFGNVLGSNGSVIPIFKEQIARGGPVTVTHPEMTRYFMTIPEAAQLVMQAGAMGGGGEVFILDMGEPVKIVDLAKDLITLSGLRPGEDIDIVFSGVRPGEKLFEELSTRAEVAAKTKHPKIFIGRVAARPWDEVSAHLDELAGLHGAARDEIRGALARLVPEYRLEQPDPDSPHALRRTDEGRSTAEIAQLAAAAEVTAADVTAPAAPAAQPASAAAPTTANARGTGPAPTLPASQLG